MPYLMQSLMGCPLTRFSGSVTKAQPFSAGLGGVTSGVWLLELVLTSANLVACTATDMAVPWKLPLLLALALAWKQLWPDN